ncbi:MAG TPA: putative glycoside hydrolase [Longimicrobiales bacterium]
MMSKSFVRAAPALAALVLLAACGRADQRRAPATTSANAPAASAGSAQGKAAPATQTTAARPTQPGAVVGHAPQFIRGIYLNTYAAGSHQRLHQLLDLADRSEINTFVVDVKDERGPHYNSQVPLVQQLTQPGQNTLKDLKTLTDTLHAHHIYAVARIVVFKDPILSKAKPDWSIRKAGGGLWTDKKGNTWVSAWDRDVWNYNIEIAQEAAKAGFDEIQFDYVRFPEPFPSLPPQVHPEAKGNRTDAIVGFLNEAKQRLHPLGVPVAADVFGLSPADGDDINIGQQWERIVTTADHVLPMVYPSHFLASHLPNDPRPNRAPGETVYKALGLGDIRVDRLKQAGVAHVARVIPWLQAFSAPWVDHNFTYGPEQAREQAQAAYQTGHEDWVFWHPGAKYELIEAAFAPKPAQRHAQKFQPTAELVSYEKVLEGRGAAAARAQVAKTAGR